MSITPISHIRAYQYVHRIRIRVSRMWRPRKFQSEAYDGLHYILIDEKGDSIHARVHENDYQHTAKMEEGCLYDIYRFHVQKHDSGYKILNRDIQLGFNEMTNFKLLEESTCSIPRYAFNFLQFHELENCLKEQSDSKDQTVLADMYGCIKKVEATYEKFIPSKNRFETIREITLENHRRESVIITFWAHLARTFNAEYVHTLPPPALAVFTSLKMATYKGKITPTGTDHTCVIFNPEIPQTTQYQTEFSKPGDKAIVNLPSKQATSGESWKTVSDLYTLDPESCKEETFLCCASILRFPANNEWWYRSCPIPNCFKTLKEKNNNSDEFICPQHGPQIPFPCYRVHMTIKDDENLATVTLKGKQAEKFFGYTCSDLLNRKEYKDEESLPEEITAKIGEKHLFQLKIKPTEKVVYNILPDPNVVQAIQQTGIETCLISSTPEKTSERKRGADKLGTPLSISEQDKKSKSQGKETVLYSSKKAQKQKEE